MRAALRAAAENGALRLADWQFACRMERLAGQDSSHLLLGAALVSHRVGEGDVCLDLRACGAFPLFQQTGAAWDLEPPDPAAWAAALRNCPVVGRPGERAPLILDGAGRLYLGRYWHFERVVAEGLQSRIGQWVPNVDRERLRAGIERLLPGAAAAGHQGPDWQRVAAALAVLRPFCLISGGPGTGKTRTASAILTLAREQAAGQPLRIALAAPTGKAAARLTAAVRAARHEAGVQAAVAAEIPDEAFTLHRLLGFRPERAEPRYGPDNPLHVDLLMVDEASMVDLPLMARLLAALPPHARVILLGDRDQLASVEAGMVLGDIGGRGTEPLYSPEARAAVAATAGVDLPTSPSPQASIANHIVVLRHSWRFGRQSGIGALARAVNAGDAAAALDVLTNQRYQDVQLLSPDTQNVNDLLIRRILPAFRKVLTAPNPAAALDMLERVRVLGAVREGEHGVPALNRRIEEALQNANLAGNSGTPYVGRPIMITANDHALRLYNGDVGLLLPDPDSEDSLRAWFGGSEGVRRLLPSRLPPYETVYAMTIHKSQGSEFDEVVLVLPARMQPILTRELVYTGITRARRTVWLVATPQILADAVARRVERSTGLQAALWEGRNGAPEL